MVRRSLLELVIAVVGSALIGFGLSQMIGGLGWETAIGVGLLLIAVVYFTMARLISTPYTKYFLVAGGLILVLLPYMRA